MKCCSIAKLISCGRVVCASLLAFWILGCLGMFELRVSHWTIRLASGGVFVQFDGSHRMPTTWTIGPEDGLGSVLSNLTEWKWPMVFNWAFHPPLWGVSFPFWMVGVPALLAWRLLGRRNRVATLEVPRAERIRLLVLIPMLIVAIGILCIQATLLFARTSPRQELLAKSSVLLFLICSAYYCLDGLFRVLKVRVRHPP
jgi:hypothetical protein